MILVRKSSKAWVSRKRVQALVQNILNKWRVSSLPDQRRTRWREGLQRTIVCIPCRTTHLRTYSHCTFTRELAVDYHFHLQSVPRPEDRRESRSRVRVLKNHVNLFSHVIREVRTRSLEKAPIREGWCTGILWRCVGMEVVWVRSWRRERDCRWRRYCLSLRWRE
jgi:hypothetical protein